MGFAISTKTANTAAACMSFISFLFLLLVNLGTPVIKSIYIASYRDPNYEYKAGLGYNYGAGSGRRFFGIYGECTQFNNSDNYLSFDSYTYYCVDSFTPSNIFDGTKFLLIMHAVGVITSLMLFCIGIYARRHVMNEGMAWIFALFSSFIVLLAMAGQIDMFLKLQYWFNDYNGKDLKLGAGGLSLVIMSLIFSLLSVLAFYKGHQAVSEGGGDINGSNDNENMNTVMTNQQKPVPQQFQIPQTYLNPQSDTNNQPYSSTNDQPVV
nr:7228_t:CDS:2 [Entrophospora candida]CAG8574522.1 2913_t:CDS:2 [Entrophospora candida]